jgi:hypothetical protein
MLKSIKQESESPASSFCNAKDTFGCIILKNSAKLDIASNSKNILTFGFAVVI